jgi:DNA-binding transcriptional ArsR family regulator
MFRIMRQPIPSSATPDARPSEVVRAEQFLRQYMNKLKFEAEKHGSSPENNSTDRLNENHVAAISNHMVERLDATFHALADPTRRAMLVSLAVGERSIGELAAPHAMSFAGAAKHVQALERAGLVERRKAGRQQLCRLKAAPLKEANAWLRQWDQFWNTRLDVLEAIINAEKEKTR